MNEIIERLIDIAKKADLLIDESEWIRSYGDGHNAYVISNNRHEQLETALEEFEDFMMELLPDSDGVITGSEKAEVLLKSII